MKFKIALMLFLGAILLVGIAYVVDISVVNMICYTAASLLMIGAMATAIGPKNFIIILLVYAVIVALYILALYLAPSGEFPYK